jgi:hypothetical protein
VAIGAGVAGVRWPPARPVAWIALLLFAAMVASLWLVAPFTAAPPTA